MGKAIVIEDKNLSSMYDKRYVVIDEETKEVLDDAQGYGYKSIRNAYAAYSYKNRDKSKDKEIQRKKKQIIKWMKEHKSFVDDMDNVAFDIAKGSFGPDYKFNAKVAKDMLLENKLKVDFTPGELLKVYINSR